ncbi:hypothetical protein RvY_05580-2 [Ramazzottius varieornatus]|uniref:ABC transporter domain-containing protein n=1 Tax=Ramazzottius varieornatus TaxID=947166 RepID=A0A1D1V148_RAMVA|nr:hypothetical protein RvY_05580-2 [Ramazzottius varieornatus]
METDDRRYFPPPSNESGRPRAEDLHAWSIYRQNINSELSTSALGDQPKKNALPYGNFALRPHQVDAILNRAKRESVASSSQLLDATNAMTYLKFGLPRVSVPLHRSNGDLNLVEDRPTQKVYGSNSKLSTGHRTGIRSTASVLDRSEKSKIFERNSRLRKSKSELDVRGARRMAGSHLSVNELVRVDTRPGGGGEYYRDTAPPLRFPSEGDVRHVDPYRSFISSSSTFDVNSVQGYRHRSESDRRRNPQYAQSVAGHGNRHGDGEENLDSRTVQVQAVHQPEYLQRETVIGTRVTDDSVKQRAGHGRTTVSETVITVPQDFQDGMAYEGNNTTDNNLRNGGPYVTLPPLPLADGKYSTGRFRHDANILTNGFNNTDSSRNSYPSLQVRSFSLTTKEKAKSYDYSFSAVTFEAYAGDLVGIMATSDDQGGDLLKALINRRGKWGRSLKGAITYNGVNVDPSMLKDRAVFAAANLDFNPDMSLKQTMLFQSHLCEPGETVRKTDTTGRIDALISDLGLSNVAATRVGELTRSEKQRLNIACQLVVDPDLVLLEQPTQNMDIFDTFFLMEYLRQWALRGRIVLISIQPPTCEILEMLTRVILLSNGRTIFSGRTRDIIPYFESLDYPCPVQKNPADYYLDLVSIDMTTTEAHQESLQRIEYLTSVFAERQPVLSELSQPGTLPPKIWRAGTFWQVIVIWIRALIFMFPYNLIDALHQIVQAVAMSVTIGIIYFGLNRNQAAADDRFGLFYVILTIGIWPVIIHIIYREMQSKRWLHKDLSDQTYRKGAYLISKAIYSVPLAAISTAAYVIPVYFMTRLRQDDDFRSFGMYIGITFLHVLACRSLASFLVYVCRSPIAVFIVLTIFAVLSALTCGYPVHLAHLWKVFSWFEWISPTQWAFRLLTRNEFEVIDRLDCQKIPVQVGGLPILTR